jgi:hypothetical protein
MSSDDPTLSTDQGDTGPTSLLDPSLDWGGGREEPSGAEPPTASTPDASAQPASQEGQASQAATVPPGETPRDGAQGAESGQLRGPIPYDRHQEILNRQRAEAENRWQRVAWADELVQAGKTPTQIREALAIFDGIDTDPVGFLERFHEQLSGHPTLAPQVRSFAARILGSRPHEAEPDPEPQPDLEDRERGIISYSHDQLRKWQEWNRRQTDARVQDREQQMLARLAPLEQEKKRRDLEAAVNQVYAENYQSAEQEFEEMSKLPHFTEQKQAIKAFMEAHDYKGVTLKDAYIDVLVKVVLPNLSHTERAKTLDTLKTQANAGRSVNPRTGAAATRKAPTSLLDPSLKWD